MMGNCSGIGFYHIMVFQGYYLYVEISARHDITIYDAFYVALVRHLENNTIYRGS